MDIRSLGTISLHEIFYKIKFFLEEAECEKKVMPAVAKKMGVSRADAYIIRKRICQKLPPKLREEFLIAAA